MQLSISNIAWDAGNDAKFYHQMLELGYRGLEIAPTRIFPQNPYTHRKEAEAWAKKLKAEYGLSISSMQSIWYGRQEKVFSSRQERNALTDYTKQAIDFAEAIGCRNLVFGCPRNRAIPEGLAQETAEAIALDFFQELGEYAHRHNTVIAMEANPPIYNTNYINTTQEALALVKKVNSPGFLLNLDVGTMIHNEETISLLTSNVHFIHHVHISEPGLKPVQERRLHSELLACLMQEGYHGFVSIEMGFQEDSHVTEQAMKYLKKQMDESR